MHAAAQTATLATRFASFAAALDPVAIPGPVYAHAKLCVLDSIGVALAARDYPFCQSALRTAQELGGPGDAVVFGEAQGMPLRDAILANGILIHSLDFDDTHAASVVHCSASALPVAFNLGYQRGASGRTALASYILAIEVDARIGEVARGSLQRRGFHPTGIVGAFGAAAGAAYLRGLTAEQHRNALGIVLSFASGSMEFVSDGAWTKRLHPGWAAVSGFTAATFAGQGFIGPARAFEGNFGLFKTLLGPDHPFDCDTLAADLGADWRTLGMTFKPYPACHFNHAFADCALHLKATHDLKAEDIVAVEALVHPDQVAIVCEPEAQKQRPQNAYEAQFSVPWIVANALVRGRFTLDELEPSALTDQAVLALAARVSHAPDPDSCYPRYFSGGLIVTTRSGVRLRHHLPAHRGSDALPLSRDDVIEKFMTNACRVLSEERALQIVKCVSALDSAPDLHQLAEFLRGEPKPLQNRATA